MTDRIDQIRRAHKSARPKPSNPAWCKTHRDLTVCLEEVERLTAEVRKLELQQRIHIGTIRDLQCGAMNYLTYPHDGERQGLDSAVKASLCIVPLEDDDTASDSPAPVEKGHKCDG